jgi:hypothetical protein
MMSLRRLLLVVTGLLSTTSSGLYASEKKDILVAFEFKGSLLSFDVGVWESLYQHLDANKIGTTIFSGSSSGSVLTAFFACNGLSAETIGRAKQLLPTFDPAIIAEDDPVKLIKIFSGQNVAQDVSALDKSMMAATNNGTCTPTHPFAIAASNNEVLRDTKPGTYRPANSKTLNWDNLDVFSKASGERLGKACTYFTNEAGAAYLLKVPAERRLCDIRMVKTPADLILAVRASVAEPTYFYPVKEPNPEAFVGIPAPANREYQGGVIMQAIVQDFKLADPEILTIASGGLYFVPMLNRFLKNTFLIDVNRRMLELNWWYDFKVEGSMDDFRKVPRRSAPVDTLIALGRKTFEDCFSNNKCHARVALKPGKGAQGLDGTDLTPYTHRGISSILKK